MRGVSVMGLHIRLLGDVYEMYSGVRLGDYGKREDPRHATGDNKTWTKPRYVSWERGRPCIHRRFVFSFDTQWVGPIEKRNW